MLKLDATAKNENILQFYYSFNGDVKLNKLRAKKTQMQKIQEKRINSDAGKEKTKWLPQSSTPILNLLYGSANRLTRFFSPVCNHFSVKV